MAYCILRTAKLKTRGNIAASGMHNFRERETPNADASKTELNKTAGAQSTEELLGALDERLATVPTVRKNAVLAVEYFVGMSPEWAKTANSGQIEDYFDRAEKWLRDRHGAENVLAVTRQYDETTPHICAFVVPIDAKGRLNAAAFMDGRKKLAEMQTDFAEKVGKNMGLVRGIEGSKAKHQDVQRHYGLVQGVLNEIPPVAPDVRPPTAAEKAKEALGLATEHSRLLDEAEDADWARMAAMAERGVKSEAKAKQYDAIKGDLAARERTLEEMRSLATVARQIPLEAVCERFGCVRDQHDKNNWLAPSGRISIERGGSREKFFNHGTGKGGGGAIDLVMALEDVDYQGALGLLAKEFGTGAVLAEALDELRPKVDEAAKSPQTWGKAPEPVQENWQGVRDYLTRVRKLPAAIVDELHRTGKVYADKFRNAVFRLNTGGVELRGTGTVSFHGVRGEKGFFKLLGKPQEPTAFVESAIDAISLRSLGWQGDILSTTGAAPERIAKEAEILRGLAGRGVVVAAFDNDAAGRKMADAMGHPRRTISPRGKDWNEDLTLGHPPAFLQREERQSRSQGHSR